MEIKFGTELKLKKDWEYNELFTFEKGEILKVVLDLNKYGMKLYHPQIIDLLDFKFNYENRDSRIEEYFEVVETFDDRLAELEKVILDYYLAKGHKIGIGGWKFNVNISSEYKKKILIVSFFENLKWVEFNKTKAITTKEMFDEAIGYFSPKGDK